MDKHNSVILALISEFELYFELKYIYLCQMKKKNDSSKKAIVNKRLVDKYFEQMDIHFSLGSKILYAIFLILTFFGIMGLIWMIPFPQFQFLIDWKMNTFLNWGSFFIAIVIYLYLKLAPTLSYAALFSISIMSFFIVQLEYIEKDGGPSVVLVCSIFALVGLLGLFLASRKEKQVNGREYMQLLGIGPIWLWSKVYNQANIKY